MDLSPTDIMESQAQEYLKQKNWNKAIELYTSLLRNNNGLNNEQIISYLTDRAECFLEMNNHPAVIVDSKDIINLSQDHGSYNVCLARKRIIHSLYMLKRLQEADMAAREWLLLIQKSDTNKEAKPALESLLSNFINSNDSKQKSLYLLKILNTNFTTTISKPAKVDRTPPLVSCIYCNVSFAEKIDLRAHCQTETHEMMIMSDDGHDWYWRPPPRGFQTDNYTLCENWKDTGCCRFGLQCVQAHGEDELMEWKERFHYREMRLQKAKEKELFGKSYTEEILERWLQSPNPNTLMKEKVEEVEDRCSCPMSATVSSKNSLHEWTFNLESRRPIKAVALLQDTYRNHFSLGKITIGNSQIDFPNKQEWIAPSHQETTLFEYQISVVFTTNIYGTFRQSVVFDFATEPILVKHLCVDVVPDSDLEKIFEIRREVTVSIAERWTVHNSDIVPFHSELVHTTVNREWEERLRSMYPCPQADKFLLSHATVTEKKFTKNNYRERMHELLFIEEMARYDLIAQYNLTARLEMTHSYILSPNSMAASTAKYSSDGELFASVSLCRELSEDTSEGRLILMYCNTVYLCPITVGHDAHPRRIYEAFIEDKGKNVIYLRLSAQTVQDLGLTEESYPGFEIQFQLNRIPYCKWHYTIDKMANFKMIFPETYLDPAIPWSPSRQWSRSFDSRLNVKQKEAIIAITTPLSVPLPPILVIGPFGTGKTFTLAQAIRELIKDSSNRILLCTHSNSAADLYIKDYLDPWVEAGEKNAKPLRIYYTNRWVTSVSPVVQKYCLIQNDGNTRSFLAPTIEDIMKHKIIVVTLSTSVYLSEMGLPQGFFTHILLDEAAQAIECETVTPLAVAHETTRLVLAGDHMQLGPDIFSSFAKERNLHISLLERLYDHYPMQFSCKILLCENYRAHESIVRFTSESFYEQRLVSSSKQPKHSKFFPLTFFTTRGEDVQENNSTAFYNNSEVYEVVERVLELKRNWPKEWGDYSDQSIGVVTPYSDQVFRIRSEFRKRRIEDVCVERVLNVQGKQFRAIILSTVRTRTTCTNDTDGAQVDYGFLSNSKLLNTAMTRAQSLVAVVGDPIALCSLGRCSKVWERFIQICHDNGSLFGITWTQLKLQLDGIELKKIYKLNPLAPEFIPRKYRELGMLPRSIKFQNAIPNEATTIPPVASPFPLQDLRYFPPLIYPNQPRPFMFNILPPSMSNGFNQPPMTNGFNQPPMTNGFNQPPMTNGFNQPPMTNGFNQPPMTNGFNQPPMTNGFNQPPMPMGNARLVAPPRPPLPKGLANVTVQQEQSKQSNKKLIQFMNNVHFPEANVLNDCINLLPRNMSLADMLLKPANLQERWYNYLRDTTGIEAAEKFKFLLHTTNQKGSKVMDNNIFERSTPSSCESPTFSWYDSPTNQINFNKPVYMTENQSNDAANSHQQDSAKDHQLLTPNKVRDEKVDLRRHINEEFSKLNVDNTDVNEVFKAFTFKNDYSLQSNGTDNANVPKFYKYFQ